MCNGYGDGDLKSSMKNIFQKPYLFWTLSLFFSYLALSIFLSGFYITIQYIPYYIKQINWLELSVSIVFTLVIAALVAFNSVYAFIKFKERKSAKITGLSCAGTVLGLTTGVCPACVTGLFPLILGFFGITFSWATLPFHGLEIQLLTILMLSCSLYFFGGFKK